MIKYLSLFSGIGAPESALEELKIDFELVGFSEIDKYAAKSYCAVHVIDETLNLGDITKINIDKLPKDIDLITHGSPCQDYSIAGKQAGGDKGTGTRSSLMWNTVEIVKHCKPKVIIWENVKNVLSSKHKHNYEKYLNDMSEIGYMNYAKVLNAKDYGIPQNRERIFVVSIRKDVDKGFEFPQKQELKLRLKDMLEESVDEKYYVSNEKTEQLIKNLDGNVFQNLEPNYTGNSNTITTVQKDNYILEPKLIKIGQISSKGSQAGTVYSEDGLSPTLCAGTHGYAIGNILDSLRIRKLTPRECWRLMGFSDEQFEKATKVCSDTQLYKQAGNSIVVNVLVEIFKNLKYLFK